MLSPISSCDGLQCTINLTEEGLLKWRQVATAVYQYIAMLSREGPQDWVQDELKDVSYIEYVHDGDWIPMRLK